MEELQKLDIKQLNILEDFINGKNIFMSGPGGTGKSFLIEIIKDISTKNIMMLDDWRKENPGCKNYDDSKNDIYLRMMVESCGPADEVSEKRDFAKIIRSIAKNTIIDKDFK